MVRHYQDHRGYVRDVKDGKLISRRVAFREVYRKNREAYPLPFRYYIVHHRDGNKLNNSPDNLELLTREKHERLHSRLSLAQLRDNELRVRRDRGWERVYFSFIASVALLVFAFFRVSLLLVLLGVFFGVYSFWLYSRLR